MQGKKAVNAMLTEYEAQDRANRPGAAVPTFRMKMPGVVSKNIVSSWFDIAFGKTDV